MAGDWIKLEHITPDKPEVHQMADILKIDSDSVVGKLIRIWIWADQQSIAGNALKVTDSFLDRITSCLGFSNALRTVGWLKDRTDGLYLPNFDRHNGKTAKARAVTNRRVSNHRANECNADTVTNSLQIPLPEKRREENKKIVKHEELPKLKDFTDLWTKAFKDIFGVPYKYDGGKDSLAATRLIKLEGYNPLSLVEIAKKAWSISDEKKGWHCVHQSKTIHGFSSFFNNIRDQTGSLKHQSREASAPTGAFAGGNS